MNVSFNGIKNIGAINLEMKESPESEQSLMYNCVNFQLDNKGNPDLDSFEKVLRKYPNAINHNFVTIATFQKQRGEYEKDTPQICINAKDLELNDENLWVYEKITKMLDKIGDKSLKTYEVSEDYLESEDCEDMLYPMNIMKLDDIDKEILMRTSHEPKHARECTKEMLETIQQAVFDYMA